MSMLKRHHFGGNIADYKQKTKEINGVGLVHIVTATDLHSNDGSLIIQILNANNEIASEELINKVQQIIDPSQDGSGIGLAPIRT